MIAAAALLALTLALGGGEPAPAAGPEAAPPVAAPAPAPLPADLPTGIAKLLAKADGTTREQAIKVKSVGQEYQIIRALGYKPDSQSLVMGKGKTYDMIEATHATTGEKRQFWFDISSFFGRGFGF